MDIGIPAARMTELATLLTSGGDSRLALDPRTGRNKYHCPLLPTPGLICFSSCTASPMSPQAMLAATETLRRLTEGSSVQAEACAIAAELRRHFCLAGLAEVLLTPSGTDATLLTMGLLAAEQPATPITSIMVAAAETGSGVPLAAAGRHFSDLAAGTSRVATGEAVAGFPAGCEVRTIALRQPDGQPRPAEAVDADFAAAVAGAAGRPVVHLMDGSKTGLLAPATVPASADVVVDACQARLPLPRLHVYLRRGWPVLITGSKFFGGPAFSGAILFPAQRLARIDRMALPGGLAAYGIDPRAAQPAVNTGTVLRWAAALEEIGRAGAALQGGLEALSRAAAARIAAMPGLVPVPAPLAHGIVTFALRDPAAPARLLGMSEARALHRQLAQAGVLLGQPVEIGAGVGALRIAFGAHTLRDPDAGQQLARCLDMLETVRAGDTRR